MAFLAVPSFAAPSGPPMPWDTPLDYLMANLTSTVARLLIIGAVVISGITWPKLSGQSGTARPEPVLVTSPPAKIRKTLATDRTKGI